MGIDRREPYGWPGERLTGEQKRNLIRTQGFNKPAGTQQGTNSGVETKTLLTPVDRPPVKWFRMVTEGEADRIGNIEHGLRAQSLEGMSSPASPDSRNEQTYVLSAWCVEVTQLNSEGYSTSKDFNYHSDAGDSSSSSSSKTPPDPELVVFPAMPIWATSADPKLAQDVRAWNKCKSCWDNSGTFDQKKKWTPATNPQYAGDTSSALTNVRYKEELFEGDIADTLSRRSFPAHWNPVQRQWECTFETPQFWHGKSSEEVEDGEYGIFLMQSLTAETGGSNDKVKLEVHDPEHPGLENNAPPVKAVNLTGEKIQPDKSVPIIRDFAGTCYVLPTGGSKSYAPTATVMIGQFGCPTSGTEQIPVPELSRDDVVYVGIAPSSPGSTEQEMCSWKQWDLPATFTPENPFNFTNWTQNNLLVQLAPICSGDGTITSCYISQIQHGCTKIVEEVIYSTGNCRFDQYRINASLPGEFAPDQPQLIMEGSAVELLEGIQFNEDTCSLEECKKTVCVLSDNTDSDEPDYSSFPYYYSPCRQAVNLGTIPEECCCAGCSDCRNVSSVEGKVILPGCDSDGGVKEITIENWTKYDPAGDIIDPECWEPDCAADPRETGINPPGERSWRGSFQCGERTYQVLLCCDHEPVSNPPPDRSYSLLILEVDESSTAQSGKFVCGDKEIMAIQCDDCDGLVFNEGSNPDRKIATPPGVTHSNHGTTSDFVCPSVLDDDTPPVEECMLGLQWWVVIGFNGRELDTITCEGVPGHETETP